MAKFPKTLTGANDIDLTKEEFVFHGERLTDERAEQLADEHSYDNPGVSTTANKFGNSSQPVGAFHGQFQFAARRHGYDLWAVLLEKRRP